jgi:transcription elongation factor GreA
VIRQPISREGYEKVREEIRVIEQDEMPIVTERIKTAREEGDLKENAEYHAAREQQGYLQAKANQLKTKLAGCEIVEKPTGPQDAVFFGARVTVCEVDDESDKEIYELVGPGEEDYDGDIMKILTSSPIASAMIGKKVGDLFEVDVPAGTLNMKILEIE